jgi:hypothetical protein
VPITSLTTWETLRARTRTFLRTWGSPFDYEDASDQDVRQERYLRLWDLYQGNAWTDRRRWTRYRSHHDLYRQIRTIADYAHMAAEFWAEHVWSGTIARDGLTLPDGVQNAVPFAADTDPVLAAAAAQVMEWSNFQDLMAQIPRMTAALGESLVAGVADLESGNVYFDHIWPGYVKEVWLDNVGNLHRYELEYWVTDKTRPAGKQTYKFRRLVTRETIQEWEDDEQTLDEENPYGFVFGRWFRHYRLGGVRGEPAIFACQAQLDELNSLLAHLLDKTHVNLESPIVVTGNLSTGAFARIAATAKRVLTGEMEDPAGDRETQNVLEAPPGTEIKSVEVRTAETLALADRIEDGIKAKLPELEYLREMRNMTQVTGPVTSRGTVDVNHKYQAMASGYDRNLSALIGQAVAVAGFHFNNGDWYGTQLEGNHTEAQQRFKDFGLESYDAGELQLDIVPRDLVPLTTMDRMNILVAKKNAIPILDSPEGWKLLAGEAGYPEETIEKLSASKEAAVKEQQAREDQQMRMKQQTADRATRSNRNQPGNPNRNGRPATGAGVK